jgi:hypothetical protein
LPGKRGRPTGSRNDHSIVKNREAADFCKTIIYDPRYRANLLERARNGTLPPQIEALLFYFVFGKPLEKVEISAPDLVKPLENLTEAELAARTAALMDRISRLREEASSAPEGTIDAEVVHIVHPQLPPPSGEFGIGTGIVVENSKVEGE